MVIGGYLNVEEKDVDVVNMFVTSFIMNNSSSNWYILILMEVLGSVQNGSWCGNKVHALLNYYNN